MTEDLATRNARLLDAIDHIRRLALPGENDKAISAFNLGSILGICHLALLGEEVRGASREQYEKMIQVAPVKYEVLVDSRWHEAEPSSLDYYDDCPKRALYEGPIPSGRTDNATR